MELSPKRERGNPRSRFGLNNQALGSLIVSKTWSLLFAAVNLGCLLLFVIAPWVGWWLPKRASSHAWDIDFLFYVILWITGFFFVLTEALLCVFMFRYAVEPGQRRVPAPAAQAGAPPPGGLF